MFPEKPPPIDPRDRALLRPLASLGKSSAAPSNVSFLRRTEYMTAHKTSDPLSASRPNHTPRTSQVKKPFVRPKSSDKNDPAAMLRTIEKSFNLAYPDDAYTGPDTMEHIRGADITKAEREAWEKPKHPTNSDLKLLDSYPIVPDISALGDTGSYFLIKYKTNPSSISDHYDLRLNHTVLIPSNTDEEVTKYNDDLARYEKDPENNTKPTLTQTYTAYIPAADASTIVPRLKRKFDIYDQSNDDSSLYTDGQDQDEERGPYFRYQKLRSYEVYLQTGDPDDEDISTKWNENIALALHDTVRDIDNDAVQKGVAPPRQKAAYVYPINQRHMIRPKRQVQAGTGFGGAMLQSQTQNRAEEDESPDVVELRIGEPNEEEMLAMEGFRAALDSSLQTSVE